MGTLSPTGDAGRRGVLRDRAPTATSRRQPALPELPPRDRRTRAFLVETNDDLCMNCHPADAAAVDTRSGETLRARSRAAILAAVVPAFAYDELASMPEQHTGTGGVVRDCTPCHRTDAHGSGMQHVPRAALGCQAGRGCGQGPARSVHGGDDRCDACHDVHDAGGPNLLPGRDGDRRCYTCHDGTGGNGVYGAIGGAGCPGGGAPHRRDERRPRRERDQRGPRRWRSRAGRDARLRRLPQPARRNTVAPFTSDRLRTHGHAIDATSTTHETNRLLDSNPAARRRRGRVRLGLVPRVPRGARRPAAPSTTIRSTRADRAGAFTYANVAVLASDGPTSATTTGPLGAHEPRLPHAVSAHAAAGRPRADLPAVPRGFARRRHASRDGTTGDAAAFR